MIGRSLQLIGLGLWERFFKANNLLEKWLGEDKDEALVTDVAVCIKLSLLLFSL